MTLSDARSAGIECCTRSGRTGEFAGCYKVDGVGDKMLMNGAGWCNSRRDRWRVMVGGLHLVKDSVLDLKAGKAVEGG